ncbi:hypothetical protein [Streptomyces sp. NBC_00076]|uniref:hypothetical protein n=1 Tax=Streptomyces sp. NBC_00076 TaxID=2975642 RepID=UPI003246736B
MFDPRLPSTIRLVRASVTVAVALAGSLLLSACSSSGNDEKNYSVPVALCDISSDPKLLNPFLPGGDSISVKSSYPNGGTQQCDVIIDGDIAVRETQTWWSDGESAATVAGAYDRTENSQVTDDDRYLYSGTGGVGKTAASCKSAKHPDQDLYGVTQVFTPDRVDPDTMKKLIISFTKALESSSACR